MLKKLLLSAFIFYGVTQLSVQLTSHIRFSEFHASLNPFQKRALLGPAQCKLKRIVYSFHRVPSSFGNLNLNRLDEHSPEYIEKLFINSAPKKLRKNMRRYTKMALDMAQKYQVDPFWVLSIMWTESHFKADATSHMQAAGLMQIMPLTGHFLLQKLRRPVSVKLANRLSYDPALNIELGVYYLGKLLKRFKGNYVLATVAYNMGPGNVRNRLRTGREVGVKNRYLDRVRLAYRYLSSDYRGYIRKNRPAYLNTFVVKRAKRSWYFYYKNLAKNRSLVSSFFDIAMSKKIESTPFTRSVIL